MLHPSTQAALHNKWDKQLGELMRSEECTCTPHCCNVMEFRPGITMLLERHVILQWKLRWHDGKVWDIRNLMQAAHWNELARQLEIQREEVESCLLVVTSKLQKLNQYAPSLQQEDLHSCLWKAHHKGEKDHASDI